MIHDIADLDDIGQKLRITWKKANDFMASFARDYFIVAQELKSGKYGNDWNMAKWSAHKIGVFESSIVRRLKAHADALADDERQERDRVEAEQQRAKQVKRQAQQAEKEQKQQARQAEKELKLQVQQAEKIEADQRRIAKEAERQAEEAAKKREKANAKARDTYHERKQAALVKVKESLPVVDNPRAAALLAKADGIERKSRVELGEIYAELQELALNKQLGINPATGKYWAWTPWSKAHITRSYQDIHKCIVEYIASCDYSHDETVVPFAKPG